MKNRFIVVIALLFVWSGCGLQASQEGQTQHSVIRFVQITDTHLGQAKKHKKITEKIVQAVNQYPRRIDFVVHTGDVIDDGMYEECLDDYKQIFSTIKVPFYPVAGNNEFDLHASRKLPQARIEECIANWKKHVGPFMQYADFPGVRIVAATTEPMAHGLDNMADEIYCWLEKTLTDAKQKELDVIVFTHTPIIRNFHEGKMSSPYPDPVYDRLKKLLNRHGVKASIAGHFHVDHLHYTGEVPVYVGATSLQGAYRLYEYDPHTDRLTYQTIVVK